MGAWQKRSAEKEGKKQMCQGGPEGRELIAGFPPTSWFLTLPRASGASWGSWTPPFPFENSQFCLCEFL